MTNKMVALMSPRRGRTLKQKVKKMHVTWRLAVRKDFSHEVTWTEFQKISKNPLKQEEKEVVTESNDFFFSDKKLHIE